MKLEKAIEEALERIYEKKLKEMNAMGAGAVSFGYGKDTKDKIIRRIKEVSGKTNE